MVLPIIGASRPASRDQAIIILFRCAGETNLTGACGCPGTGTSRSTARRLPSMKIVRNRFCCRILDRFHFFPVGRENRFMCDCVSGPPGRPNRRSCTIGVGKKPLSGFSKVIVGNFRKSLFLPPSIFSRDVPNFVTPILLLHQVPASIWRVRIIDDQTSGSNEISGMPATVG
jgi:hypothetical protein